MVTDQGLHLHQKAFEGDEVGRALVPYLQVGSEDREFIQYTVDWWVPANSPPTMSSCE